MPERGGGGNFLVTRFCLVARSQREGLLVGACNHNANGWHDEFTSAPHALVRPFSVS